MNPVPDNLASRPTAEVGDCNVVEIRDGESLTALVDQPLPTEAQAVVPEKLSIRVQIRRARLATRSTRMADGIGWLGGDRWALAAVLAGLLLIGVAGVLALMA